MPLHTLSFGTTSDGREARLFVLTNGRGMVAAVTDLGACLTSLRVPDGRGSFPDVVLGFDGVAGYEHNAANLGAVVGRSANRIAGASVEVAGRRYALAANEGANSLHSGPDAYFERLWEAVPGADGASVAFRLVSPDGDQGFPGSLDVRVTYSLGEDDVLSIGYDARPDAPTVVNLTNHSYFNLNGHASGSALGHVLELAASEYTPSDEHLIPTGEVASVAGTPMDFRHAKALGRDIRTGFPAVAAHGGFDHNYVLPHPGTFERVATLVGDVTGIAMEVSTDAPGLQLYTSNGLDVARGKDGAAYGRYGAVCLETQFFPDAVHHPEWPQPRFTPERPFVSRTSFAFGHRG